jgi:hypothetical protein
MTIDEICAAVAADTKDYVGPALIVAGDTVTLARHAPGNLDEILDSAKAGWTWRERDREYGTCAAETCHLGRPIAAMRQAGGRWWCPDETPKD